MLPLFCSADFTLTNCGPKKGVEVVQLTPSAQGYQLPPHLQQLLKILVELTLLVVAELGFVEGVVYEVIAVSFSGEPHPAPIGVRFRGGVFEATIYHDTATYANLKVHPMCTLNVVGSGLLFYDAVYMKHKLRVMCEGDYWFLADADAWLGVTALEESTDRGKSVFKFKPEVLHLSRVKPKPYTRADSALVEMLVHESRIKPYIDSGLLVEAKRLYDLIAHYNELVARIAQNTEYQVYAKAIYESAKRRMGELKVG
jgi:hypothetical protein